MVHSNMARENTTKENTEVFGTPHGDTEVSRTPHGNTEVSGTPHGSIQLEKQLCHHVTQAEEQYDVLVRGPIL